VGSLDEVDVVELLRGEFTRGSLVYGSALSGDCDSGSNATERAGCEHFLQVRTVGVGREGTVREVLRGERRFCYILHIYRTSV